MWQVRCVICGAKSDLDVAIAHEFEQAASAEAVAVALEIPRQFAPGVLGYLRLHRVDGTPIKLSAALRILRSIKETLLAQKIRANGRDWTTCDTDWLVAFEQMSIQARTPGKLKLPLTSNCYLFAILANLSDAREGQAEVSREAKRAGRTPIGANHIAEASNMVAAEQHHIDHADTVANKPNAASDQDNQGVPKPVAAYLDSPAVRAIRQRMQQQTAKGALKSEPE